MINFKVSNKNISKYLDEERFFWIRIIKKYNQNYAIDSEQWKTVIEKTPLKTVKKLADAVQGFFKAKPSRVKKIWRPLHIAAKMGFLSLCKHIVEKTHNSSSGNSLMMAADGGSTEVVQFLLENTRKVNSQDYKDLYKGWTPLHYAADKGHFDICQLLIKHGAN